MTVLYHATFRAYVDDIRREGLRAGKHFSYAGSDPAGCVYFSFDADMASSFAEAADAVPDDVYNSGIVVIAADSSLLDGALYRQDDNILDPTLQALVIAYEGTVPPEALSFAQM